jgi:PAS domain S-box-containing protein
MTAHSIPTIVMAGLSLYVGLYHLLIYTRRKNHPEDLTFALLCLATCAYEVLCTGLYNVTTVADGVRWQRLQFISLAIFVAAFLWFVSDYTHRRKGVVVYAYTAFYLCAIIVQIVDRSGFTWLPGLPSIKTIGLPFGMRITYYEATLGIFTTVQGLIGMAATFYIFWCGARFYAAGNRKEAVPLLVALGVMFLVAFNDTAVSNGLYQFIYLIEYGYAAMIILMAFSLSRTVVDAAMSREALRQAELVIENSPAVLFRWRNEENWPVEYVSGNIRRLGYEPGELLSGEVRYTSLIHPDDRERVGGEVRAHSSAAAESFSQEYRVLTRDGTVRWMDDRTTVIRNEAGIITHYQGIVVDITDRRRIEAAFLESEEKFRSIVENAVIGIFTVNDSFQFIYCNDELCRILGRPLVWMLGRDFREVLAPGSRELVAERYLSRRRGVPAPSRYEVDVVRGDGEQRHLEMSVTLVRDSAGRPRSMGQLVDITDRTRAEEEIRRLNSQLEERVRERTAELEAAVKELEAFTYSVSHDLRAPLRSLGGFASILLQDFAAQLPGEAARHLGTIQSTARQMGRLIDDLLGFSRLNRQPLVLRTCSMDDILRDALATFAEEQAGRDVEISVGALPDCRGDPGLLRQVWLNLLSNALKFTRGCPRARIEIGHGEGGRAAAYFVRDNGVGFDMQYVDKLFGVFQRLHRDDEFEGTGIGLAIVKRIVNRHGGGVWADSAAGRGTTFSFTVGDER